MLRTSQASRRDPPVGNLGSVNGLRCRTRREKWSVLSSLNVYAFLGLRTEHRSFLVNKLGLHPVSSTEARVRFESVEDSAREKAPSRGVKERVCAPFGTGLQGYSDGWLRSCKAFSYAWFAT